MHTALCRRYNKGFLERATQKAPSTLCPDWLTHALCTRRERRRSYLLHTFCNTVYYKFRRGSLISTITTLLPITRVELIVIFQTNNCFSLLSLVFVEKFSFGKCKFWFYFVFVFICCGLFLYCFIVKVVYNTSLLSFMLFSFGIYIPYQCN